VERAVLAVRYFADAQGSRECAALPGVLTDRRRFRVVHEPRHQSIEPAPLKVKEVCVEQRRYVMCINEKEVEHDRARGRRSWPACASNSSVGTSRW
jgi:hypothetical protein